MANLNLPFLLLQEGASKFTLDTKSSSIISDRQQPSDDMSSNILLLSDKSTGCLALCDHDALTTTSSKLLVSVKPKILCVPSIYPANEKQDVLLDQAMISSPAPRILGTSDRLMLTLHRAEDTKQGTLRIWSTEDGRCIMTSPRELLHGREPVRIEKLPDKQHPGVVLCACESNSILIINIYTMTLVGEIEGQFNVLQKWSIKETAHAVSISVLDEDGKILIWSNKYEESFGAVPTEASSRPSIASKPRQFKQCSKLMLGQCNDTHCTHKDEKVSQGLNFTLKQTFQASGGPKDPNYHNRGKHREILNFVTLSEDSYMVVFQDRIEMVQGDSKKTLLQYEKDDEFDLMRTRNVKKPDQDWFVYAEFINLQGYPLLLCLNSAQEVFLYEVAGLVAHQNESPAIRLNLFSDGQHFDPMSGSGEEPTLLDSKQTQKAQKLGQLQSDTLQSASFHYFADKNILYTFNSTSRGDTMISWSIDELMKKINPPEDLKQTRSLAYIGKAVVDTLFSGLINLDLSDQKIRKSVPMSHTAIEIFGSPKSKEPFSLLNISPFIVKNYFTRWQHSFFYGDEKITDQAFYVSTDFPSIVVGTNYGRIFIVQLFQDIEGRSYPVVVLDCHHSSPITSLYVAYSSVRRAKQNNMSNQFGEQRDRSSSQQLAGALSTDSGGHLIACSEDGTISLTNMNSGEIQKKLSAFTVTRNDREKRRIDQFMKDREHNHKIKRRQSFSQCFTTGRYFNLVRAQPLKVFDYCAHGGIQRILEVQILQQNQLERQRYIHQLGPERETTRHQSSANIEKEAASLESQEETKSTSTQGRKTVTQKSSQSADRTRETSVGSQDSQSKSHPDFSKQLRDINLTADSLAASPMTPLLHELMPFRASYACIDTQQNSVYLLQMHNMQCDMIQIHCLDSKPIGVYEDAVQGIIHVVTDDNLNVYSYSKRSKKLLRKSNFTFAWSGLHINQILHTLIEKQHHFKVAGRLSNPAESNTQSSQYDLYSFQQQFQGKGRISSLQQASGHHKVLDYLSLSLSLPLYFHPHDLLSQKFTKTIKDLLPIRNELRKGSKNAMRSVITNQFVWNDRYKSDFCEDYYQSQGAVTPLHTGQGCNADAFRQQMIVINTKDMINVVKSRMKSINEAITKPARDQESKLEQPDQRQPRDTMMNASRPTMVSQQSFQNLSADYLQNSKWPTRLLSLVHPFTLDENLDENLELFFGLSVPFVDFRIGVQGVDEAFSFVISRDNERDAKDVHNIDLAKEDLHSDDLIKMCRLSRQIKKVKQDEENDLFNDIITAQANRRPFVNSEFWKTSSYMSTVMSAYFLSTLVSIVEYAQPDITTLMQDWLNAAQFITSSSMAEHLESKSDMVKPLSVSTLSQLMLRKDHSISSCARDVIMKPLLSSGSSMEQIKEEISEWQDLIMDTYLKLKEDSSMRQAYLGPRPNAPQPRPQTASTANPNLPQDGGQSVANETTATASNSSVKLRANSVSKQADMQIPQSPSTPTLDLQAAALGDVNRQQDKSINHFFGELEIRGLVNLSYYALYSEDGPIPFRIDTDVQNRLCKCTVILTREIMTKFTSNPKEYQNLLTILMQILQTQMRAQVPTFRTRVIQEDVIKILLLIYDFHKKALKDEKFLTRVVAENFHLIHPKNSELYLKLTAAKTLLEIGTYFTEEFLRLIQEQATTLKDGPEYQRNVLDVLRYFINGSRDGLEPYLILIVQTLLKCLDPNDEVLRRNSTSACSLILSTMVRSFTMIAFHHETQRLAVGTPNGPIAIYDVRTSAKWKILEGHQKNVICVEFDPKGNLLASYSAVDLTLRLWRVGNSGFFSAIMGGTGKSIKDFKLDPLPEQKKPQEVINPNKRMSKQLQIDQKRAGGGGPGEKSKIKFISGDKAVELTREDGSIQEFKIQK